MSVSGFAAEVQRSGGEAVVRLSGELEDAAAGQARAALDRALGEQPERLTIELSELEFMDSTGIWLLVETHRRCVELGVRLRLDGQARPEVAQALKLSGVEGLMSPAPPAGGSTGKEPIALRLYLSSRSAGGTAVAGAVRSLAERLPGATVKLEVIDVFDDPARARLDRVIATPTLIKVSPEPELRLIGSIADPDAVIRHLGLADLAA